MIDIEFAELHNPLFLAGTNLQMKLDPNKRTGLKLQYSREYKELHVTWLERTAIVPTTNVSSMTPYEKQGAVEPVAVPARSMFKKITAQVDTPMSHVFAGPGAGKTGKDK